MKLLLAFSYILWTGSCLYSFYTVYKLSQELRPELDPDLFTQSNIFPGLSQDNSDLEWHVFVNLFLSTYHWIILYVIASIFLPAKPKQWVQISISLYSIISLLSLSVLFILSTLCLLIISCVLVFRSKLLQYSTILFLLLMLHSDPLIALKVEFFNFDDAQILLFDVAVTWLLAKLTSFSIDYIDGTPLHLMSLVGYLLYLPTFFTGPIHLYHLFDVEVHSDKSIFTRLVRLARIILYAFCLQIVMHFIYVNAVQYYHELLTHVDGWSFFGFGYMVTVVFYLKYLVLFGFAHELAAIDGIDIAAPPTCVSIVCRSLLLWKTFDRGLHTWLLHYFYIPLSHKSKILATATCFTCVALWHSLQPNIVIWCTVNFISVIIERALDVSDVSFNFNCLLSSPLFATMVISNVCFLTNESLAALIVKRLCIFPIPLLPVLLVMYAGVRVSFHQLNYNCNKV